MLIFCVCVVLVSVCQCLPLSGWIQSPGFPYGYGSHVSETWRRCAPPGHILSLTLLHLDLEESYECKDDALQVSEGQNVLAQLCGKMTLKELQSSVNPSLRSSSGGCLSLTFQSDYSNTERHAGFKAFYTTQDVDECWENDVECSHFCHNYIGGYSCSCKPGYYLADDQHECRASCTENHHGAGVLTAPGSPGPYFENADCIFSLSADEGNQLELKFTGVFDVESRDGKCIDYLTIKTDTETFGPFCGKDKPAHILTAAQQVRVLFHSDTEGTNRGFSLEYKPKVMECPGKVTPNSVVSPVKDRYQVGESVTVRCLTGYVLPDATETFRSTCQLNGNWSPRQNCELVNCGPPELPDLMVLTEENPSTSYEDKITVKCSSVYYNLVGNAHFTCDAAGVWVAENGQNFSQNAPQCVAVCGVTKTSVGGRILGGKKATLGQIPWQLLIKGPKRGGASLINDRWAITAAHVVENQGSLMVTGGMVDGQDEAKVEMQAEKIIIHPNYPRQSTNYDNDIALVKLSSRVPLSENIIPVCLPKTKTNGPALEGKMGTVSGYGLKKNLKISQYLQYAHVKEYEGFCFENNMKVTENMFCAGEEDSKVDSCKGDSGGPLVIPMVGFGSSNTPYTIKGLVSWGPPCEVTNYKGYYTKVENYLDWIRETMANN
ncbi:mannan-binding lectin serine protease 2 isoform X2 [Ictalurus punctatus]|uniref:Mannan-binding lectin serine protease 2 isoform X2 n=1 Tax=Ictalurus punctatus TaxID=7998 RepID=A0A2D0REU7_ICTPU|nr:mannan-binding lectin serine protease 2 isoform X2 [Ictalurus punctatus]